MNDINPQALFRFFHRFLNPPTGSGRVVSEDQLALGPDQFKNLLNNMRLLAQEISPVFFDVKGISRKATIDFAFFPWLSKNALAASDADEGVVKIRPEARIGGEVYIYATETITKSPAPWVQVEYGFWFEIEPNQAHTLHAGVYAGVQGAKVEWVGIEDESLLIFDGNKKAELVAELKRIIHEALEKAVNEGVLESDDEEKLKMIMQNTELEIA